LVSSPDFCLRNDRSRAVVLNSPGTLPQDHSRVRPAFECGTIDWANGCAYSNAPQLASKMKGPGNSCRGHTQLSRSSATASRQFPGSPNANSFLGPWPEKVPLPQNTMPSEIDAPALHGAPVSYDQRMAPVLAFIATILPMPGARLQPKTTSFVALTAPSARLPFGSLVVQITAPVRASSAAHPPALVLEPSLSVQSTAPEHLRLGRYRCWPTPQNSLEILAMTGRG